MSTCFVNFKTGVSVSFLSLVAVAAVKVCFLGFETRLSVGLQPWNLTEMYRPAKILAFCQVNVNFKSTTALISIFYPQSYHSKGIQIFYVKSTSKIFYKIFIIRLIPMTTKTPW